MPAKQWEEEESSSSAASSPQLGAVRRVNKFADEEADDSDVLDSWDAADDSEAEREKAKKAAEVKAKADAEAAAKKKSKAQRIAEHQADRARRLAVGGDSSDDEDETESQKRERLRRTEQDSDLRHAQELFGEIGITKRKVTAGSAVPIDPKDPNNTVDLSALPLFNPLTKLQFENLRNVLVPVIGSQSNKAHYVLFLQEFTKQLAKDLPSDQIKKISSTLTALSNEKMKEEKAADKGGKKSKAQKTKTTLAMARPTVADTNTYEEAYNDDNDFM